MNFPSKETIARLRETYPAGTRVELISMDDPYTRLNPGEKGRVDFVDDGGTIHISWDSGFRLGAVYGVDSIGKIDDQKEKAQPVRTHVTGPNSRKPGKPHSRGR